MTNPFINVGRACRSAIDAFNGAFSDAPVPAPPISLTAAIKEAKQAEIDRNVRLNEFADLKAKVKFLSDTVASGVSTQDAQRAEYSLRAHELFEAKQMLGAGPWLSESVRQFVNAPDLAVKLHEATPISAVGAYGDIELALQNVEWRREVNLSWMEFSRWGIQQIILISRLYYIKHPWIRRGINLSAAYVFGQGVELSSPNPHANEILKSFIHRNKSTLGLIALTDAERKKSYDGNLFWVLFPDREDSGDVNVRMIDATEINDIICNPEDSDEPWFYRRGWTSRNFDKSNGSVTTSQTEAWYPALNYDPEVKEEKINGVEVLWDHPVYHRKCGGVAKWLFGCPRVYPALDWAREGRKFLEAFASVWQALRQYSTTITTKGGQQALAGIKGQMGTTVGPSSSLYDVNPPAGAGSMFGSGPGTKLEAFKTTGAGGDASDVKEFRNMTACVLEIPPTWLGDMETSNLSTAQTLDRPTELGFLTKQEEWQEDLVVLGSYQLKVSARAMNGSLREAYAGWIERVQIREAKRVMKDCHWHYEAAAAPKAAVIEVMATFPSIREGDAKDRVSALVEAMTLGNKGGQVIGIDEKAGVRKLYDEVGIDGGAELAEEQYPAGEYDPDRTKEPEPPPIQRLQPNPGGIPQVPGDPNTQRPGSKSIKEAGDRLIAALQKIDSTFADSIRN